MIVLFMLGLAVLALMLVVACIVSPGARRVILPGAAILALIVAVAVVSVVRTGLREIDDQRKALERIAPAEVELQGLDLSLNARGEYRLTGFVHNMSMRYTLTDATFDLILEDCVAGNCREQARYNAESLRHVPPGQTLAFDSYMSMTFVAAPAGERRFSYHVRNTWATDHPR